MKYVTIFLKKVEQWLRENMQTPVQSSFTVTGDLQSSSDIEIGPRCDSDNNNNKTISNSNSLEPQKEIESDPILCEDYAESIYAYLKSCEVSAFFVKY